MHYLGGVPISKRQQKKLLKKQAAKQNRQEKKAMKKEESKAKAAAKRKEMDERVSKMTAEEREAYRQKAHAASQVAFSLETRLSFCYLNSSHEYKGTRSCPVPREDLAMQRINRKDCKECIPSV